MPTPKSLMVAFMYLPGGSGVGVPRPEAAFDGIVADGLGAAEHQLRGVPYHLLYRYRLPYRLASPGEGEELSGEALCLEGRLLDALKYAGNAVAGFHVGLRDRDVPEYAEEQVVEVVGYASGKHPDGI